MKGVGSLTRTGSCPSPSRRADAFRDADNAQLTGTTISNTVVAWLQQRSPSALMPKPCSE